jgi:hypothetical protein
MLFARRGSFGFVVTSSSSFEWRHMLFDAAELWQEAGPPRRPPPGARRPKKRFGAAAALC